MEMVITEISAQEVVNSSRSGHPLPLLAIYARRRSLGQLSLSVWR
jgi:hypothetical protein